MEDFCLKELRSKTMELEDVGRTGDDDLQDDGKDDGIGRSIL